jgi:hypothetical protein
MNELDEWASRVRQALELGPPPPGERALVLDLARDVAHGVLRPAAPISTYLLGVAVGQGADPVRAAELVTELALGWRPPATD